MEDVEIVYVVSRISVVEFGEGRGKRLEDEAKDICRKRFTSIVNT
jgi:hypothetical protein